MKKKFKKNNFWLKNVEYELQRVDLYGYFLLKLMDKSVRL